MTGGAPSEPLQIRGLVKSYGSVRAVRGIDLAVRAGEVFGFVGPNGAGKSTTIRCILDLLRPTTGEINVFGRDPRIDGARIRERVAYVPGELRLPERLTGRQFLRSIGRLRARFEAGRMDELAERFTLDLDRPIRQLSSGNRRKVSVLSAFLSDADLLILDEPTGGLDPLMQHEFLQLVRERRAAGATVFLSSHILSEMQSIAARMAVLRAGRIVAAGTVNEVRGLARQRVEVWFDTDAPAGLAALPGIGQVVIDGRRFAAVLTGCPPAARCPRRAADQLDPDPGTRPGGGVPRSVHREPGCGRGRGPEMNARAWELLAVPMRAARRAGLVWGLSLAALIVLTVAFYPAFRDQPELSSLIAGMPSALVDAFGLADFGTPAGFLRGNLYAVLVPLMLALAGVLLMNGQTAADEDSGRMEPYLAQPVTRVAVFGGRGAGVLTWLLAVGALMLAAQLACDVLFGIDIGIGRVA